MITFFKNVQTFSAPKFFIRVKIKFYSGSIISDTVGRKKIKAMRDKRSRNKKAN